MKHKTIAVFSLLLALSVTACSSANTSQTASAAISASSVPVTTGALPENESAAPAETAVSLSKAQALERICESESLIADDVTNFSCEQVEHDGSVCYHLSFHYGSCRYSCEINTDSDITSCHHLDEEDGCHTDEEHHADSHHADEHHE